MIVFQIRPLDASANTASFQCGVEPLDEYIRRYASQDMRMNVARVFVAVPENNPQHLAGFFTLSAGSVSCSILLADACRKVSQASTVLAVAGIIVDAKDDKASAFYKHFGFIPLQGQGDRMVLPASVFQTE